MSALLFFNYAYTANAAQTTTLTVSGEQQDSRPEGVAVPDEIVVVDVSAAELNNLMDVGTQGTTGVGYPQVVLDWASVTSLTAKWTSFMAVGASGVAPIDFQDNSEEGNKPTLQKVFSTASFEFTTNAGNVLLSIPPEAIKNVDYSGAIALTYGQTTLSPTTMSGAATILGESVTAGTDESLADSKQAAVRGLFLQALAAGRYQQSPANPPSGSDLPAGASPGFDFQAGDMVKVYTVLSLTKTRSFIPATDDATVEGSAGMKFVVDGTNIVVDGQSDTVASDVKTWTVEWQLKVSA
jgi:hypothetical protein